MLLLFILIPIFILIVGYILNIFLYVCLSINNNVLNVNKIFTYIYYICNIIFIYKFFIPFIIISKLIIMSVNIIYSVLFNNKKVIAHSVITFLLLVFTLFYFLQNIVLICKINVVLLWYLLDYLHRNIILSTWKCFIFDVIYYTHIFLIELMCSSILQLNIIIDTILRNTLFWYKRDYREFNMWYQNVEIESTKEVDYYNLCFNIMLMIFVIKFSWCLLHFLENVITLML